MTTANLEGAALVVGRRPERLLSGRRARSAGRRRGGVGNQPARAPFHRLRPHPGLAPARPSLVRVESPGHGSVPDDDPGLRRTGPVAGPLRAGDPRGGLPCRACRRPRRPRSAQGVPARDRLLLRVLRERSPNPHRPRRVSARPRDRAPLLRRPRDRLLCGVLGGRTERAKASRSQWSRMPAGPSIWRDRWTPPGRR